MIASTSQSIAEVSMDDVQEIIKCSRERTLSDDERQLILNLAESYFSVTELLRNPSH